MTSPSVPEFDPSKPCQMKTQVPGKPVPTMCKRCHNPHHACDQTVPEGTSGLDYRFVPSNPTSEMKLAGQKYASDTLNKPKGLWWWGRLFQAMIAASPTVPPLVVGQGKGAVQVKINYTELYWFAATKGIDYNELCQAVHTALIQISPSNEAKDKT
jgi:hypothetical protein